MTPDRVKHLELIQAVVTRLAGNSSSLKTWTVTIVAALFALAADKANPAFIWLAIVPVVTFWFLDGYYLRQERLFRALYYAASKKDLEFSMYTAPYAKSYAKKKSMASTDGDAADESKPKPVDGWFIVTISWTLSGFYLPLLGILTGAAVGLHQKAVVEALKALKQ